MFKASEELKKYQALTVGYLNHIIEYVFTPLCTSSRTKEEAIAYIMMRRFGPDWQAN
jgi:hypothetical protein